MKDCIGEQREGLGQHIRASFGDAWHGKFGHINVLVRDHDSLITGYGAHDRVVAFCVDADGHAGRIDTLWQLGSPSDEQILTVFRSEGYIKGDGWKVSRREEWNEGKTVTIYLSNARLGVGVNQL